MDIETLIPLAWILASGGLVFAAIRYASIRRGRVYGNRNRRATDDAAGEPPAPHVGFVRDPVCGMSVAPSDDICWIHNRYTYYFCSMSCRGRFRTAPESFLGAHTLANNLRK